MATKYVVVSTQWAPDTIKTKNLAAMVRQKAKEFIDAGLSVSGLMSVDPTKTGGDKLSLVSKGQSNSDADSLTRENIHYGPIATNMVHTYDPTTDTYHSSFPAGEVQKNIRLFTTVQAANEFIDFVLTLGAESSVISTPEEYAEVITLPPDSVIDQYVATV